MEKWIIEKCEIDTFNVGDMLSVFGSPDAHDKDKE